MTAVYKASLDNQVKCEETRKTNPTREEGNRSANSQTQQLQKHRKRKGEEEDSQKRER